MKKIIILMQIIFLFAFFQNTFAQKKVIYLNNGSVIRGKIIDSTETKIRIQTKTEDIWAFEKSEIQKIEFLKKQNYNYAGFQNFSSLGFLIGQNYYNPVLSLSLTTINGFYLNKENYLGLGVGIEYFEYTIYPIFVDFKYFMTNKKISPFIDLQAGYSFATNYYNFGYQERNGGLNLNGEFGFRNNISSNFAMTYSFGYHFQKLTYNNMYYEWGGNYTSEIIRYYNRCFFKIGFVF